MNPLRALGITLVLLLVLAGCGGSNDTRDTPTEAATLLQEVSLRQLYEESVANLARYDALYKGKWFLVTGTVAYLFDYQVVVDAGPGDGDVTAVLTDVPRSDQIPLDAGDSIAARCRIGEVIGYGVYMENCSLE